jgi:hypothetical protein
MTLDKRINAFVLLGKFLKQFPENSKNESLDTINKVFYKDFEELILRQFFLNGWFDKENVLNAVSAVANSLSQQELNQWLLPYQINDSSSKKVGVIMAGNIPMVGFHDFLSVLITGNTLQAKMSSNDNTLLRKIGEVLVFIESSFKDKIHFVEKLENFDAVIATGSNNSARYFDYYFGKYPHIIRKNRNSIAIVNEKDMPNDIEELGKDIFQYYGLGCRNVSKLYFPKKYRIDNFFEAIFDKYHNVTQHNKYANNYDYNKAVFLLGNNELLDNDFLLLKEDKSMSSPVGVMFYEYYDDINILEEKIKDLKNEIQCVVSSENTPLGTLRFGEAQSPKLNDYADGVDTIQFLVDLA